MADTLTTPLTPASFASFDAATLPTTSATPFFDAVRESVSSAVACARSPFWIVATTATGAVDRSRTSPEAPAPASPWRRRRET